MQTLFVHSIELTAQYGHTAQFACVRAKTLPYPNQDVTAFKLETH